MKSVSLCDSYMTIYDNPTMLTDGFVFRTWRTLLRYLIPPVVLLVMIASF